MSKVLSTRASHVATSALRSIPFGNIIGGPLAACVEAQRLAAETTINFIKEVGLQDVAMKDPKGEVIKRPQLDAYGNPVMDSSGKPIMEPVTETQAVYVCFQFIQGGRMVRLNVPMLTIVPIPYIAINTIDINFKANISASSTTMDEDTSSDSTSRDTSYSHQNTTRGGSVSWRRGGFGASISRDKSLYEMKGSVSSKKDSRGTQESKYSVEYTMDVAVHASQDSMPAGLAKVLEMIGSAIDLCDPLGEFMVNGNSFTVEKDKEARFEAVYKTPEGLFSTNNTDFILIKKGDTEEKDLFAEAKYKGERTRDRAIAYLTKGTYILKSSDKVLEETITVEERAPESPSKA